MALGPPETTPSWSMTTDTRSPYMPRYWAMPVTGPLVLTLAPGMSFNTVAVSISISRSTSMVARLVDTVWPMTTTSSTSSSDAGWAARTAGANSAATMAADLQICMILS